MTSDDADAVRRRRRLDAATVGLDAPFALVDLDAFDVNAADMARRAGGMPIRVASKSIRVRSLLERALSLPGFAGVLAFTAPEAIWLAEVGTSDDIVVGYPSVDRTALTRLRRDARLAERITVMIDDIAQVDLLRTLAETPAAPTRVCLDVDASYRPFGDVHLGARRSPLHAADKVAALASEIAARPDVVVVGLMSYDAQVAGVGDAGRGPRAIAVRRMQAASLTALATQRQQCVDAVAEVLAASSRPPLEFVNGGGTGSLHTSSRDPSLTELAAGSGLLAPRLFDGYRAFHPEPAAWFALPVVRRPSTGRVTVLGGGYSASGAPGLDRLPTPELPPGLRYESTEGAGEVQTPLRGAAADELAIGDRVWFRHAKAGELAERFELVWLLAGDDLRGSTPTYRGEGRTFL